jgi:hypothetical protein
MWPMFTHVSPMSIHVGTNSELEMNKGLITNELIINWKLIKSCLTAN